MPLLPRFGRTNKPDKFRSTVWDKNTTRAVVMAFVFLALGILISWQWQRTMGKIDMEALPDRPQREQSYWEQVQFVNPDLDPELKEDAIAMGWRVCGKVSAGWSEERILAYISQEPSRWDTNKANEERKKPMLSGQLVFFSSLQDTAERTLCPEYKEKADKKRKENEKSGP